MSSYFIDRKCARCIHRDKATKLCTWEPVTALHCQGNGYLLKETKAKSEVTE